jgi:hypothetical protein
VAVFFCSASSSARLCHRPSGLLLDCVCGCLQVKVDVVFELSDQKARCFLVLITLKQLLHEYARKVFDEMSVRT